jgi:hypothetical protein
VIGAVRKSLCNAATMSLFNVTLRRNSACDSIQ